MANIKKEGRTYYFVKDQTEYEIDDLLNRIAELEVAISKLDKSYKVPPKPEQLTTRRK